MRGFLYNHDEEKCHRLPNFERDAGNEVDEVAEFHVYSIIPEQESFVRIVPMECALKMDHMLNINFWDDVFISFYTFSQTTVSGNVHAPSEMTSWLGKNSWLKGHVTNTTVPPPMVVRNSRGPFLFKFCRVVYDKENKRLRIRDGEFVGKTLRSANMEKEPDYEEAVLHLEIAESLTQGIVA